MHLFGFVVDVNGLRAQVLLQLHDGLHAVGEARQLRRGGAGALATVSARLALAAVAALATAVAWLEYLRALSASMCFTFALAAHNARLRWWLLLTS